MSTQPLQEDAKEPLDLLQGTLDFLILRTLIFGSQHGQGPRHPAELCTGTSRRTRRPLSRSPAPRSPRLDLRKVGHFNRKARFYSLTAAGRRQLIKETNK